MEKKEIITYIIIGLLAILAIEGGIMIYDDHNSANDLSEIKSAIKELDEKGGYLHAGDISLSISKSDNIYINGETVKIQKGSATIYVQISQIDEIQIGIV